ncbi:ribosome-associated translation inhibitor RaiA [Sulfurimonas sp. HSL3-7]|uniref:ribosome hibernation-promoting factor, HPF/YfiA family n=1 Tax=Sulfonitrofixus jiaomeiensis TaxID=3131938 RepID=UPI0031F7CF18
MNVQIRTKDITLNDSTKAHIEAAIEQFKKFSMDITTTNVVLTKEKNGVGVEFEFHIAHNTPIVINQSDRDLDAAIDVAIDRASKALRRMHDKNTDHRTVSIKDLEVEEQEV